MSEEKEVQVNVRFSIAKLLNYGAIAVFAIAILWGILDAAGDSYSSGSVRFAEFLKGLWAAIVGAGVLAAAAELVSSRKE